MKRRILSWLMALLLGGLFICPAAAESEFPDVDESDEYAEAVAYVSDAGIMVGDDKGNFKPDKFVTRAEMAAIICRMLDDAEGLEKSTEFMDVPINHWANAYVRKVVELGIVNGYGNGKFGPADDVTYEQATAMIIRALGYENEASDAGGYPDGHLSIAQSLGLLEGIESSNSTPLNRASVAIVVYNCYHSYV